MIVPIDQATDAVHPRFRTQRSVLLSYFDATGGIPAFCICAATRSAPSITRSTFPPVSPARSNAFQPRRYSSATCATDLGVSDQCHAPSESTLRSQGDTYQSGVLRHVLEPDGDVANTVKVASEAHAARRDQPQLVRRLERVRTRGEAGTYCAFPAILAMCST